MFNLIDNDFSVSIPSDSSYLKEIKPTNSLSRAHENGVPLGTFLQTYYHEEENEKGEVIPVYTNYWAEYFDFFPLTNPFLEYNGKRIVWTSISDKTSGERIYAEHSKHVAKNYRGVIFQEPSRKDTNNNDIPKISDILTERYRKLGVLKDNESIEYFRCLPGMPEPTRVRFDNKVNSYVYEFRDVENNPLSSWEYKSKGVTSPVTRTVYPVALYVHDCGVFQGKETKLSLGDIEEFGEDTKLRNGAFLYHSSSIQSNRQIVGSTYRRSKNYKKGLSNFATANHFHFPSLWVFEKDGVLYTRDTLPPNPVQNGYVFYGFRTMRMFFSKTKELQIVLNPLDDEYIIKSDGNEYTVQELEELERDEYQDIYYYMLKAKEGGVNGIHDYTEDVTSDEEYRKWYREFMEKEGEISDEPYEDDENGDDPFSDLELQAVEEELFED